MGSKRRYKVDLHKTYSERFDNLRMQSVILNDYCRTHDINHAGSWTDKQFLTGMLLEWQGDESGQFRRNSVLQDSRLTALNEEIEKIQTRFEHHQIQRVNTGHRKLDQLPAEMQEEQLLLEAEKDVLDEEIEYIQECLSKIKDQQKKVDDHNMLKRGPQGSGRLHDGILCEFDGQKISKNNRGELFIDEPSSPYYKMLIPDYREFIVLPWKKASRGLMTERNNLGRKLKDRKLLDQQWPELKMKLMKENDWAKLFSLKFRNQDIPDPKIVVKKEIEKTKK